jgi:hypothetical protein
MVRGLRVGRWLRRPGVGLVVSARRSRFVWEADHLGAAVQRRWASVANAAWTGGDGAERIEDLFDRALGAVLRPLSAWCSLP